MDKYNLNTESGNEKKEVTNNNLRRPSFGGLAVVLASISTLGVLGWELLKPVEIDKWQYTEGKMYTLDGYAAKSQVPETNLKVLVYNNNNNTPNSRTEVNLPLEKCAIKYN